MELYIYFEACDLLYILSYVNSYDDVIFYNNLIYRIKVKKYDNIKKIKNTIVKRDVILI